MNRHIEPLEGRALYSAEPAALTPEPPPKAATEDMPPGFYVHNKEGRPVAYMAAPVALRISSLAAAVAMTCILVACCLSLHRKQPLEPKLQTAVHIGATLGTL